MVNVRIKGTADHPQRKSSGMLSQSRYCSTLIQIKSGAAT
jgi:hypothetical protein